MKDKSLFIKNVFNLIRNKFPEFSKVSIGLNTSGYPGRDTNYNPSYIEFSLNNEGDDIDNININIINDFSETLSIFNDVARFEKIYTGYRYSHKLGELRFIQSLDEELSEELLIVLWMLNSFGTIHCMLKFKELSNVREFQTMITANIEFIRISRGSLKPYTIDVKAELEDNFLFTNLHADAFKYKYFHEIWNAVKYEIIPNITELAFEVNKYYKHSTGEKIYIVGEIHSDLYIGDIQLVVKSSLSSDLKIIGSDPSCTANWYEISEGEWEENSRYGISK